MKNLLKLLFIFLIIVLTSKAYGQSSLLRGVLSQWTEHLKQKNIARKIVGDDENYEMFGQFSLCVSRVENDNQFYELTLKAPIPSRMSFSHRIDDSYATDNDKLLIGNFVTKIEECIDTLNNFRFDPAPGELFAISNMAWTDTINDLAYVYDGIMTWGEYNTRASDRANHIKLAYATWESNLQSKIYSANEIRKLNEALYQSNSRRYQLENENLRLKKKNIISKRLYMKTN